MRFCSEAAAALADARNRAAVGRLVNRVLHPRPGPSALAEIIAEIKAEARASGLTDADIDAEMIAYNRERRVPGSGDCELTPNRPSVSVPIKGAAAITP